MAIDAELRRLIREKAAIQAAIDQMEDDNTVQGSFADVEIRRVELRTLNCQRDRVNARIQQRKAQLIGARSPTWGSVIRARR